MKPERKGKRFSVVEEIRPEDIGVGAFYYFASTAVIGIMNYVAVGRSVQELAIFFAILSGSMVMLHVIASVVSPFRTMLCQRIEPLLGIAVTASAVCACLSMLFGFFFYVSAFLAGCSCAAMIATWTENLSRNPVRESSYRIPAALVVAVLAYVAYRLFGLISVLLANGWLVTVPLVGMLALLMAYSPDFSSSEFEHPESRSFKLLGIVAAVLAVGSGLFAYLSGFPGSGERAQFTLFIPLEIIGICVVFVLCSLGMRLAKRDGENSSRTRLPMALLTVLPLFLLGCLTGLVSVPGGDTGFLWEASIWVLLVAAFAYDMRTSLYAMKGTAIGLMFESWCMGQMLVKVAILSSDWTVLAIAAGAGLLYLGSITRQLLVPVVVRDSDNASGSIDPSYTDDSACPCSADESEAQESALTDVQMACERIGRQHRLTAREIEVLCLVAEGRTAKFISEELVVSYNTARSHMRHVYEKLDIHSKQDIISLVHSVM